MKVCGIYVIRSTMSENIYIGQSLSIKTRVNLHLTNLRSGRHHCSHLQRAWNLYGEDAFIFDVLEQCSAEKLTEHALRKHYEGVHSRFIHK